MNNKSKTSGQLFNVRETVDSRWVEHNICVSPIIMNKVHSTPWFRSTVAAPSRRTILKQDSESDWLRDTMALNRGLMGQRVDTNAWGSCPVCVVRECNVTDIRGDKRSPQASVKSPNPNTNAQQSASQICPVCPLRDKCSCTKAMMQSDLSKSNSFHLETCAP